MNSRSLTVLMIDKYYFIKGGAERYYFELTSILELHGLRVVPFSMRHPDNLISRYTSYFVSNIDFFQRNPLRKIHLAFRVFGRILYSVEARRRLDRLIRQVRPDVAHLHMIDHQISPSILHTLKKHGIPVIQTVHQYKLVCPNYLFFIPWRNRICTKCLDGNVLHPVLERCHKQSLTASGVLVLETFLHRSLQIYRLIDRFHVPSRFMGEMLERGGISDRKIVHHNYCIRIEDFPQSRNFDDFYLYIGRLSPEKGIITLLEAAARLPNHPLFLIGDGPERSRIEKYLEEHAIQHIQLKGELAKDEVIRWISRARFVVVPSEWYENSPLVIYESFALGKPVIGAHVGGIPELVEDQVNGLLFPPKDSVGLRSSIQLLMTDITKCRAMGEAARKKAEALFSGEKHYPFMMGLYQSLLDESKNIRESVTVTDSQSEITDSTTRRIRLLQVVNGLAIGGAEKKLLDVSGRLDPNHYQITICSIGQGGPLEKDFRALGIEVIILPKRNRSDIKLIWQVAHLIRERKIDIVQTTLWLADVVGAFAAKLAGGVPVISWETVTHGDNDILRTRKKHVLFYRIAMKTVDKIVAVSNEIKESLVSRRGISPSQIETVHYGVDLIRFNRSVDNNFQRTKLDIRPDQIVIGTVARMETYKGVTYLQQAAIRLAKEYPSLIFIFAGDGSLRPTLEEEVHSKGLSDQIRFLGFRDDVQEVMQTFDIFVLPSLTEGLPNVILEAMASAKPVIATRVGGIPEAVVSDITGLLISPAEVAALVDAIRKLVDNPSLAKGMGEAGRKRVENLFSVEHEVACFEKMYEYLMNEGKVK